MAARHVHITSGRHTHATDVIDVPIREQGGERSVVRIGAGAWIGSGAIIMADVGSQAIVGAGSVVTKDIPDYALVVGNPARQAGWMSRHGHRLNSPAALFRECFPPFFC